MLFQKIKVKKHYICNATEKRRRKRNGRDKDYKLYKVMSALKPLTLELD